MVEDSNLNLSIQRALKNLLLPKLFFSYISDIYDISKIQLSLEDENGNRIVAVAKSF